MADAAELQQSIKRYKETNRWLSELLSSDDAASHIAQRYFVPPALSLVFLCGQGIKKWQKRQRNSDRKC